MGEWNRSSRECTLESLRPEIMEAIQKHIAYFNLGPILKDYRMCIETSSTKKKKGLFGRSENTVIVTALITPRWLVWSIEEKTVDVKSVKLQDLVVADYKDTFGYKLIPDTGIELTGAFTGSVGMDGNPSYFIGLGEEPSAAKFKETLIRSVQKIKQK